MTQKAKTGWMVTIGVLLPLGAELAILLGIETLKVWITPLCWTGYILLLDAFLFHKKGESLLRTRPRHFLLTLPLSVGLWLIFEAYNLILKNWEYLNVPLNPWIAYPGYVWSFATILPALLETNALLEYWGFFKECKVRSSSLPKKTLIFSFCLGLLFQIYPLLTRSVCDFPPVWLGFIFLLEPFTYRFGGDSLLRRFESGDLQRFLTLLASGGIMGFLWEFWNYWAGAKWVYHIPLPTEFKIFEMPLLGFLGFFSFGIEFYVMYQAALLLRSPRPCIPDRSA